MGSVTAQHFSTVKVHVSGVLSADAASTWDVVKDFGAICQWAPTLEVSGKPQIVRSGMLVGLADLSSLSVPKDDLGQSVTGKGAMSDGWEGNGRWSSPSDAHRPGHHRGGAHSHGQCGAHHVCFLPPLMSALQALYSCTCHTPAHALHGTIST